ncbi:MAG: MMPL family transporter [Deltaproteobacteria bacterium]|nr:MMPL family transporter [Deltaproteobacteria bacterium]
MTLRGRIESSLARFGWWIIRFRWVAIVACLAVSIGLTSGLRYFWIDNSDEAFLAKDDVERLRYEAFKREYDNDDLILVIVRPPEIFDLAFLGRLRAFQEEIEAEVPYLNDLTSILNARNTYGKEDELVVEDMFETWPKNAAELEAIRARIFANPLLVNTLISANGEYTALQLKPFTYSTKGPQIDALDGFEDADDHGAAEAVPIALTEAEGREMVEALYAIRDRFVAPDFQILAVGGPAMEHAMAHTMQRDVTTFMTLSNLAIGLLLAILFRRVSGVILPLAVVTLAMLSAMGAMSWLDIPFSITLNMLPAFLIVVGVCDSVHILVIVYRELDAGASRDEAIVRALSHSGLAVVMTSVTTAAGLASFSVAKLLPVAQLGIVAPTGVLLAMAFSLVLLPALLAVVPIKRKRRGDDIGIKAVGATLARVGGMVTAHPIRVVVAWSVIGLVAIPGIQRAYFSHDGMKWFPKQDPVRQASDVLDTAFGGSGGMEVIIHTHEENGLHDPEMMRRIEQAMRHSETMLVDGRKVSQAYSLVDVLKETHQALNENRPEFYRVPDDRLLLAQELLLFENSGSDDLEDITDSQFSQARMSLRMHWVDAMAMPPFLERLAPEMRAILGPDVEIILTGGGVMFSRIFENVVVSLARSYTFALVIITPLMILLIGNLKRGLMAMIPNLTPVYLVIALMGYLEIPLDMTTLLIGGVVIGLAVDDTIHFMHKFNRYFEDTGDPAAAVHETLITTGSALLFTSLILSLGFSVFMAAYMVNLVWLGLLLSFSIVVAFLADITLAPALMMLVTPKGAHTQVEHRSAAETSWSSVAG